MKRLAQILILLITCQAAAFASEGTQSLLNELLQPRIASGSAHSKGLPTKREGEQSALFTLEELREGAEYQAEPEQYDFEETASDIPLALNDKVNYFINYFTTTGRGTYSAWLSRSSRYMPMMREILRKEGLPDDLAYVAMIESGFKLHARSWANAVGPWQFMSATGRRYALRIDQWVDERKDPVKSTMAAAMYLKDLYGMFNNDWYLATAGYNAGENKIFRAIDRYDTSDFWELSKGSYLKRETKEYVPKLLAAAIIAKDPGLYGFNNIATLPQVEYDTVPVQSRTDLELVAQLTGTSYQTIKELNPALLHWCTPPNYPDYELNIPKGTARLFVERLNSIPLEARFTEKPLFSRYRGGKHETLQMVAKRFGSTAGELAELNGFSIKTKVAGRTLIVPVRQSVDFSSQGRKAEKAVTVPVKDKSVTADVYYTVRRGDTLFSLARRFNVSVKLLTAWNNLQNSLALKPGKRLIVARAATAGNRG